MTPIITTMSAPAGRGRRVKAPGVGGGGGTPATPFFSDDFAGLQRNNANGFTWGTSASRVSVVSFDGYNCLRFRYGPNASGSVGEQGSVEQTFTLGRQVTELWLEYYLYIPTNLVLRSNPPQTDPNKFLALWPNTYSTIGETYVVTEFWRNNSNSTSYARMLGYGDRFYADGTVIRNGDAFQSQDFINITRAGQWNRVRAHYKIASGAGQTDGVWEGWLGDALMWRSRSDWVFWSTGGLNYIAKGYFMGPSNPGYTDETNFYIRDPNFYDADPLWGIV